MSQIQTYLPAGGAPAIVETLTGNTGGPVGPTGNNINVLGGPGVTVAGNPGTSTLTITVAGEFVWNEVTGTTQAMAVNNGYIANNAGLVTLTLPAVAAFGDRVIVGGKGNGGWLLAQNALQVIHADGTDTTVGVAGSLASTVQHDTVSLVCITANTDWLVIGITGNLTVT